MGYGMKKEKKKQGAGWKMCDVRSGMWERSMIQDMYIWFVIRNTNRKGEYDGWGLGVFP